ncbi:MAG: 16S rRNA (guanine(966)-N(2))-methyltransferase RsmD [Candidatus Paracaedimonas acanthamoebae]|uniref:16S rRNA (Guanine(966)-N(2))-methyltransferase RsmD n=1 Tax=Candidatus Paracaedimonas acanthamoebae TaxID=244581 RepID=A0A8J7PSG9_9PROT|nr:16S rRNA (guanine(966)-N(2))-methyltransferase RsmD [Candidatus Paracaedimonas acanthamoebae]
MRVIAGSYKGYNLKVPNTLKTRPTSDRARETIFNILNNYVSTYTELEVLDIFAGSGALGLEALSRGASSANFIEIDREAIHIIYENIAHLKVDDICKVSRLDARRLPIAYKKFDLIFMDAPYNKELTEKALKELFEKAWIAPNALFIIETSINELPSFPSYLTLLNERHIGLARVFLLKFSSLQ